MTIITVQHTSASICLNECWDKEVLSDAEMALNKIVPEVRSTDNDQTSTFQSFPYKHTLEGADDMPAHVKTALIGASLCIPINNGQLVLGKWQGVWLCEHRNSGSARDLAITIQGAPKQHD
jgi:secondary thiamine-phosphate synthase enzyme